MISTQCIECKYYFGVKKCQAFNDFEDQFDRIMNEKVNKDIL